MVVYIVFSWFAKKQEEVEGFSYSLRNEIQHTKKLLKFYFHVIQTSCSRYPSLLSKATFRVADMSQIAVLKIY